MSKSILISSEDFHKISQENEFWLWHLLPSTRNLHLDLQPLSEPFESDYHVHFLQKIAVQSGIPIFETKIIEVIDKVLYLDNIILQKLKDKHNVEEYPAVLGFNYDRFVYSTLHNCYCPEGVLEIMAKLNPEFVLKMLED